MRWLPQIDQGLSFHLNNTLWGFLNSSICCDYVQMAFICHPFQSCSVALWLEADDADQITAGLPAWKGYSHNGLCEVFPLNTLSLFSPLLVFLSLFLEHLWLLDYICAAREDWKGGLERLASCRARVVPSRNIEADYDTLCIYIYTLYNFSPRTVNESSIFTDIETLIGDLFWLLVLNDLLFYCFPPWTRIHSVYDAWCM